MGGKDDLEPRLQTKTRDLLTLLVKINDLISLISVTIIPWLCTLSVHKTVSALPSLPQLCISTNLERVEMSVLFAGMWVHCLEKEKLLIFFLIGSIAKISFKGKQRNDPSEAERLGNMSIGTKVSSTPSFPRIITTRLIKGNESF